MPARLFVLLTPRPGLIGEFRLMEPSTATLELPAAGLLPDLPPSDPPYPARVFVPAEQVGLHQAELPTRNPRQIRRAVPFVLEDQLADSVDNLHFAVGPSLGGLERSIAVVSTETVETWLAQLAEAHIRAQALIPDVLALPIQEGGWTLYLGAERALVRTGRASGFACEAENLPILLQSALADAGEAGPAQITVYREGDATAAADLPVGPDYRTQPCPDGLLALLCQTQPEINLLQGRYEIAAPWKRQLAQWRVPAAMAALWLVVLGIGAFAEYARLENEHTQLEAANREIFFEILPDAQRYAGARMRVEKRLQELEGGAVSEGGLLPLLAEAATALAQRKDIVLEQLQYRAGRLDVDLLANDTQILETLMQGFREKDLEPQLVSASRDGDKVRGRLRLTEGTGA